MGKLKNPACEGTLINILKDNKCEYVWDITLVALAKVSRSANTITATTQFVENSKNHIRMTAGWALGKMGSRDVPSPAPARLIAPAVEKLCDQLTIKRWHGWPDVSICIGRTL